jgi:hypothetical protein
MYNEKKKTLQNFRDRYNTAFPATEPDSDIFFRYTALAAAFNGG